MKPTARMADHDESERTTVKLVTYDLGFRLNKTSAIAKQKSKASADGHVVDQHPGRTRKKIWAAVATFIMVLGAIAAVIALFL
ncbi:hypothetical protein [Streptomyces sp. YIM 98790]|uniref:hypothetical protein n=1 Tax=Streptomyces sp. YIM 98790 TaxID=2689077 RepID=UPI001409BD82|nr:hypothetical protein [Streptomyces sp. YIM 98790]